MIPNQFAILAQAFPALPTPSVRRPLPAHIQYLPPGVQELIPARLNGQENREARRVRLDVTPASAQRLQQLLAQALQQWRDGAAPRPWLDENHKGESAVAFPTEFFWGGADPKLGGVRLRLEWTGYGEQLLRARAYGFFSPALLIANPDQTDSAPAAEPALEVAGLLTNVGGLVNEPAFRSIQEISARAATVLGSAPALRSIGMACL